MPVQTVTLPSPSLALPPPSSQRLTPWRAAVLQKHKMWVALEAGSGIVSQHDYDPESSCEGWAGCSFWSHGKPGAWWNVTNDPAGDPQERQTLLLPTACRGHCPFFLKDSQGLVGVRVRVLSKGPAGVESPLWAFVKYR